MPLLFAARRVARFTFAQKLAQLKALAPDAYEAFELLVDESLKQCRRDARAKLLHDSYHRISSRL